MANLTRNARPYRRVADAHLDQQCRDQDRLAWVRRYRPATPAAAGAQRAYVTALVALRVAGRNFQRECLEADVQRVQAAPLGKAA